MTAVHYEPVQFARERLAQSLLAQDQRNVDTKRASVTAGVADVDTEREDRRAWALAEARNAGPAIRYDGGQLEDRVLMTPAGPVVYRASSDPVMVDINPRNEQGVDDLFTRRQREAEDVLLVSRYGLAECLKAGIVDAGATGRSPAVAQAAAVWAHKPGTGPSRPR